MQTMEEFGAILRDIRYGNVYPLRTPSLDIRI